MVATNKRGLASSPTAVGGTSTVETAVAHETVGGAIIGKRARIWWAGDRKWYCGLVRGYSKSRGHLLAYDDGEVKYHHFDEGEQYELEEGSNHATTVAPTAVKSISVAAEMTSPKATAKATPVQTEAKAAAPMGKKAKAAHATDTRGKVIEANGVKLHLANNVSGYRGVTQHYATWSAKSTKDGADIHLGMFATAVEAAVAYATFAGEESATAPTQRFPKPCPRLGQGKFRGRQATEADDRVSSKGGGRHDQGDRG